jgi:hypothetical protein
MPGQYIFTDIEGHFPLAADGSGMENASLPVTQ